MPGEEGGEEAGWKPEEEEEEKGGAEEGGEHRSSWLGPVLSCHPGSQSRDRSDPPNTPPPGKEGEAGPAFPQLGLNPGCRAAFPPGSLSACDGAGAWEPQGSGARPRLRSSLSPGAGLGAGGRGKD